MTCDFFESDTLWIQISDCSTVDSLCIDIPLEDIMLNYNITDNGALYTGSLNGCDIDTTFVFYYENITGSGEAGPYFLEEWSINGVIFSGDFPDMPALVDSMNLWNPSGNWVLNDAARTIVGGTPGFTYTAMDVFHPILNMFSQISFVLDENPNGSTIYFQEGIHEFIVSEIVGDCADTVLVLMACINAENTELVTEIGQRDTFCLDFSDFLTEEDKTIDNFCPDAWGQTADFELINNDSCIAITALDFGIDSFCIHVCDEFGFCDTSNFFVIVPNPGTVYEHYDTIAQGYVASFCFNTDNLIGEIQNIYNDCPTSSGNTYTSATIDSTNGCIDYQGEIAGGEDTTCWVVCDNYNICDTTFLYVWVGSPVTTQVEWVETTVFLNTSGQFCPDQGELIEEPESIVDRCALFNGEYVSFEVDGPSFCVNYTGLEIGCDTACLFLADAQTTVDTTYLVVCTQLPEIEYINDTLMLGESPTYCISTDELGGTTDSIQFCEDFSGNTGNFAINNVDLCVTSINLSEGVHSVCLYICDDFNVCDTTILNLTVIPSDVSDPPVASDDSYITSQNDNLVVHFCENDSIPGNTLTNGYPLLPDMGGLGPNNGEVAYVDDCSLDYTPNSSDCPFADSLTYVICNEFGCDTANIFVLIECDNSDFQIFNGFSPNNDGLNDEFRINGLEEFPDHVLRIYNRWGNQVLETRNYQNDWYGTHKDKDLPDGTYYYLLDDGNGNVHSGFVALHR